MKKIICVLTVLLFLACTEDADKKQQKLESEKLRKELFQKISSNWKFIPAEFSEETFSIVQDWLEWNNFYHELLQKPQTDIGAFKRKAKKLVGQSEVLRTTIPPVFNTTQVQSRLVVIESKIKLLDMYLSVEEIPTEDVVNLISQINVEVQSVVNRMNTILEKRTILMEDGEEQMLRELQPNALPADQDPNLIELE